MTKKTLFKRMDAVVPVRMLSSTWSEIKQIVGFYPDIKNRTHFVRCAVSHYIDFLKAEKGLRSIDTEEGTRYFLEGKE